MKIAKFNPNIISNDFLSLVKKNYFNKYFIYQQAVKLIKLYKLENYINNIVISDKMNNYFLATYSYSNKKIVMYINHILNFQLK